MTTIPHLMTFEKKMIRRFMHAAHCKWKKNNNNSHFTHVHILNYMHIQARQSASWLPMRKLSERERERGKDFNVQPMYNKGVWAANSFFFFFFILEIYSAVDGGLEQIQNQTNMTMKKRKRNANKSNTMAYKMFGVRKHAHTCITPTKKSIIYRQNYHKIHTHTQTHGRNIFAIKFQLYGISI